MNRQRRRLLSQNFLLNRGLVSRLIRGAAISSGDTVLEIGPGEGIVTQQLLQTGARVVAIEVDPHLCHRLKRRFANYPHLTLIEDDFLRFRLPAGPYKVFANLPFRFTGDIIRKLLTATYSPCDSRLVVQSEAASKFMVHRGGNTMAAMIYHPWWEFSIEHRFARTDFFPPPRVDTVLLHIHRRSAPFLPQSCTALYRDLVAHRYTRDRLAKFISPDKWLRLLGRCSPDLVRGSFARWQRTQSLLPKIHRTRADPNWKKWSD